MSDLSATAVADAPAPDRTLPSTIVLTEKDFATLVDLRQRCEEARARYNSAAEDAKSKKKAFEGAREVFETNFDRIVKQQVGPLTTREVGLNHRIFIDLKGLTD